MASFVQFGQERIVVSLEGREGTLLVNPGSVAELVLEFSLEDVIVWVEDNDIVLECANGEIIRLIGARSASGVTYIVDGLDALPSLDAFLAKFASRIQDRRTNVEEDNDLLYADSQDPRGNAHQSGGNGTQPDGRPGDANENGQSVSPGGQAQGSGLNLYQTGLETLADRAGSLVPTIDRYDDLGTNYWEDNSSVPVRVESPLLPSPSAPIEGPPDISFAHRQGPEYLSSSKVMEGDAYGMHLRISLSKAPEAPFPVTLVIGGSAVMDDGSAPLPDYANWTGWELVLSNGTVIPALDCMQEIAPGQYQLTLPAGFSDAYIRVPLEDNTVSQSDRTFTYKLQNTGEYQPSGGMGGTIVIVDESRYQDSKPDWQPPSPDEATPFPPDYNGPRGPVAHVVVKDGTNWTHENGVLERDTSLITYKFELYDQETGGPHTVSQASGIEVVLQLTGKNGLVFCDATESPGPGNDYILQDIVQAFQTGGAQGVVYNSATGELSFTLPQGWNAGAIEFTAKTVQDTDLEVGVDGKPEALQITVASVFGDEALRGQGAYTNVYDAPLVGVSASAAEFFESSGHPNLSNSMTFTFTLTSPSLHDITLDLDWLTGSGSTLTSADISYVPANCTTGVDGVNGLPTTITIPAGKTSATITITASDDALSELRETIGVTIDSAGDGSYLVGNGSNEWGLEGSASTVLVDDTDAIRGGGAYCDGPVVRIVATDASGNVLLGADGNPLSTAEIPENSGTVHYKLALYDKNGNPYTGEREDLDVTFSLTGKLGTDIRVGETSPTGNWDMNFSLPSGTTDNGNGTYTVTIGKLDDGLRFSASINADTDLNEVGEGFTLSVTGTDKNESSPYNGSFSATILAVPVLDIARVAEYYSESGSTGPVLFTIGMGIAAPEDITVKVQLSGSATDGVTLSGNEADIALDGITVQDADGNPLSVSYVPGSGGAYVLEITVPQGTTGPLSLGVPITDDALKENDESIIATILPENNGSATDRYQITSDTGKQSATSIIVDDTQPWPGDPNVHHGTLSGPKVLIECVKTSGTLDQQTEQSPGRTDRDVEVFEKDTSEGYATYRVSIERDNSPVAAQQDVAVTVRVDLHGGMAYGNQPITGDFYCDLAAIKTATGKDATISGVLTDANGPYLELSIIIPKGQSSVDIPISIVQDRLTETDRWLYDAYGRPVDADGNVLAEGAALVKKTDESFTLTVAKVEGNEASIHENYDSVHTRVTEEAVGIQVSIDTRDGHDIVVREDGTIAIEVSLTQAAHEDVIVILKPIDGRPETPANGNADSQDFLGTKLTVTIPKGQEKVTVYLEPNNDTLREYIEKFGLQIDKVIGGEAIPDPSKSVVYGTLSDDMNGPALKLTADQTTVNESANPDGDNLASFTIELTGSNPNPSEPMTITLRLNQPSGTDPADVAWDAARLNLPEKPADWPAGKDWLQVEPVPGQENQLKIIVPEGYTGINNDNKITFDVVVIDDALSEGAEQFSVSIVAVEGSEATVVENNPSVTITDDTDRTGDINAVLDGPYVHLTPASFVAGEAYAYTNADGSVMYISESDGVARFYLTLRDENGKIVEAEEDITVVINYRVAVGTDTADVLFDFEELPLTVVIPKGSTNAVFEVELKDDALSELNEHFTIGIQEVSGNEARLLEDSHPNRTQVTVIVDDTQPWPDNLHAFTQDTIAGIQTGESISNAGKTPSGGSLPDNPIHADRTDSGVYQPLLNGPEVLLSGVAKVREDEVGANYRVTLVTPPVEPVTVTLELTFENGLSMQDILPGNANPTSAEILAVFKTANPGSFVSEGALVDSMVISELVSGDPSQGLKIEIKIPAGICLADFKVPVGNDTLGETGESLRLTLTEVSGSEAWISHADGADSVVTEVLDDGNGPKVTITAFDPDRGAEGSWDDHATIVGNKEIISDYDSDEYVRFKVQLENPSDTPDETITVNVLINGVLHTATIDSADPASAIISVLKSTYAQGSDHADKGYPGQFYTAVITSVSGAEAAIGSDPDATAEIHPWTGGTGPWTNIQLENITPDGAGGTTNTVLEDNNATFRITLNGGNGSNMYHADKGDGTFDLTALTRDLTVTFKLAGRGGSEFRPADPTADFMDDFVAEFILANSTLGLTSTDVTWNQTDGTFSITFKAGTQYNTGLGTGIEFVLPAKNDGLVEGNEGYSLSLQSGGPHTYVGRVPVDMVIKDSDTPTISLSTDTGSTNVTEQDGTITVRIEMNTELEEAFTVNFDWSSGMAQGEATPGSDFIPPQASYTFHEGTTDWAYDDVKEVWYYDVPITINNDERSEGAETFEIRITSVTGAESLGALDYSTSGEIVITIDDGVFNGPLVYFDPYSSTAFSEADTDISFQVLLSAPAVEDVYVWVRIGNGTGDKLDYNLSGLSGLPGVEWVQHTDLPSSITGASDYNEATQEYVKLLIPEGKTQVALDLQSFIKNDQMTEETETLSLELAHVEGGEVTIREEGGLDTLTISITDDGNGPKVNISANKTEISEESFSSGSADTVTYTFELAGGAPAEQPVTITFKVEAVSGTLSKMLGFAGTDHSGGVDHGSYYEYTVTIPVGESFVTWTMDTLINDGYVEGAQKFNVTITNVENNESTIGDTATASVAITENDHAPVTVFDNIIMLVGSGGANANIAKANLLANDSDVEVTAGDETLKAVAVGDGQGTYGTYTLDADGSFAYTLDTANNNSVSGMKPGEVLQEKLTYTVADHSTNPLSPATGWNPVTGNGTVWIVATDDMNQASFERCFTDNTSKADWIIGSADSEIIDGRGGADFITAGAGNDTLHVYDDGKGRFYGDAGSDTFILKKDSGTTVRLSEYVAHGGIIRGGDQEGVDTEEDTLAIKGNGLTLDLTDAWETGAVSGIEIVDISRAQADGTANTLEINNAAVNTLTSLMGGSSSYLRIDGKEGDCVRFTAGEGWAEASSQVGAPEGYVLFVSTDGMEVLVKAGMHIVLSGNLIDMTGKEAQYQIIGDDGGATLKGGLGDDVIIGGDGADTIYSGGGKDSISAGGGADKVYVAVSGTVTHSIFGSIDGGDGSDTLYLQGTGYTLSLAGIGANVIKNVETIDISTTGAKNTVLLDGAALANICGSAASVSLTGTANDSYVLSGTGWTYDAANSDPTVTAWKHGGKTLYVAADMIQTVDGTTGNNTLSVYTDTAVVDAKEGNDQIIAYTTGFTSIDGGADTDTLKLDVAGATSYDLDVLGAKVTNVEIVDISSTSGVMAKLSGLLFDGNNFNTENVLKIDGSDKDSFCLTDAASWTYGNVVEGRHVWTHANGRIEVDADMSRIVEKDSTNAFTVWSAQDVLDAGDGNDTITLKSLAFGSIDGGVGFDTLIVDVAGGGTLDLTAASLQNLERIKITAGTEVKLDLDAIKSIVGSGGTTLEIDCTAGQLVLSDAAEWVASSTPTAESHADGTYHSYTHSSDPSIELLLKIDLTSATGG